MKDAKAWQRFIANCAAMQNETELSQFFNLVLTPAEREKVAARYMILAELIHGHKPQREIAAELSVSIFNVTRGANQLKLVDAESKNLIQAVGAE